MNDFGGRSQGLGLRRALSITGVRFYLYLGLANALGFLSLAVVTDETGTRWIAIFNSIVGLTVAGGALHWGLNSRRREEAAAAHRRGT